MCACVHIAFESKDSLLRTKIFEEGVETLESSSRRRSHYVTTNTHTSAHMNTRKHTHVRTYAHAHGEQSMQLNDHALLGPTRDTGQMVKCFSFFSFSFFPRLFKKGIKTKNLISLRDLLSTSGSKRWNDLQQRTATPVSGCQHISYSCAAADSTTI